jgi:hypothetical protein
MQIYAVASGLDAVATTSLVDAVTATARSFGDPRIPGAPTVDETAGELRVAAVSHVAEPAGARRYHGRAGDALVLYDGLPIAVDGSFYAEDAERLAERWEVAPGGLTGIFSAVRADLATGAVECMTDPLGLSRVYLARRPGGFVLSSSVGVIRRYLGLGEPDLLAMSTVLTLGWAVGGHMLVEGVEAVGAGQITRLRGSELTVTPYSGPLRLAHERRRWSIPELTERLVTATRAASRVAGGPLVCGITSGRDSRVLMGLARAAGTPARYHTVALPGAPEDVEWGGRLAALVGAEHEVFVPRVASTEAEWTEQTGRFMAQLEGTASVGSMSEWLEHQRPEPTLGVRLWGMGGEVGRAAIGLGTAFAGNVWGLRSAVRPQAAVVHHKVQDGGGIVRTEAVERSHRYLDGYLADQSRAGWPPGELAEVYYAFERVSNLFSAGTRRAAPMVDAYSPFASREFLEYSFACSAGERYVEAPHRRLLAAFDRELFEQPWERPWRPQRPQLAPALVLGEAARQQAGRARARLRSGRRPDTPREQPFGHQWLEGGIGVVRELAAASPDSPVWEVADRAVVLQRLSGAPEQRRGHMEHLCRVATLLWYFNGPPRSEH